MTVRGTQRTRGGRVTVDRRTMVIVTRDRGRARSCADNPGAETSAGDTGTMRTTRQGEEVASEASADQVGLSANNDDGHGQANGPGRPVRLSSGVGGRTAGVPGGAAWRGDATGRDPPELIGNL